MASALRTISRVVAGTQRPDTVATKGALPSRARTIESASAVSGSGSRIRYSPSRSLNGDT